MATIDSYPVVIVAGDIELTAPEGQRLAQYVKRGGTLLVADAQFTGPGVAALQLPAAAAATEAAGYRWLSDPKAHPRSATAIGRSPSARHARWPAHPTAAAFARPTIEAKAG